MASVAVARGLCSEACGIFIPQPGTNTCPALQGGFLSSGPPGKYPTYLNWILILTMQDRCSIRATSEDMGWEGPGGSPQVCSLHNMCSFYLSGHTGAPLLPAASPSSPLSSCMAGSAFWKPSSLVEQPSPKRNGACYVQVPLCQLAPPPAGSCVPASAFSEALEFVSVLLVMHTALSY